MEFKAPKGTSDILPDKAENWRHLEDVAVELFGRYGYRAVITPIFERTEVFARSIGATTDIVQKEMYTFNDKAGRSLTLRPENTAPVVRSYVEHNMRLKPQPVKLYYIGPMFRYERPQAGRYRQFWQMGVECIGSDDPGVDVEVIALLLHFFETVGLKNLKLYLNSMGCLECRPVYVEKLKDFAVPLAEKFCPDCRARVQANPLRLFDCKNPNCAEALRDAPKLLDNLDPECRKHFDTVRNYLDILNIKYEIEPGLVRGLDYYTKTTFEVVSPVLGAQNAIGGGGRYDGLVEQFGGAATPAIGFALGTERLALAAEKEGIEPSKGRGIEVYVAIADNSVKPDALKMLRDLRQVGLSAEMDYADRSLRGQIKAADRLKARYTVILGPNELARSVATMRNMDSGEQIEIPLDEAGAWLRKKSN